MNVIKTQLKHNKYNIYTTLKQQREFFFSGLLLVGLSWTFCMSLSCNYCSKIFKKPSHLTIHERIHTGEVLYFFLFLFFLDLIVNNFHTLFLIIISLSLSLSLSSLFKIKKPFKCTIENCESSFARKENLVRHLQSHTGKKDFKCHECGHAFGTNYHLRRHFLTHQTNKSFICNLCSEIFTKKTLLRDHKLKIHQIAEFQCG